MQASVLRYTIETDRSISTISSARRYRSVPMDDLPVSIGIGLSILAGFLFPAKDLCIPSLVFLPLVPLPLASGSGSVQHKRQTARQAIS